MSLLGVYVIIGYYSNAKRNKRYRKKITNQQLDVDYLETQIIDILSYQSDALHWNLVNIKRVGELGKKALDEYVMISQKLNVEMHSQNSAEKRIEDLLRGREKFINLSRMLAETAQKRERLTTQPKERLSGEKAIITIKNYLGGYYYFTVDEARVRDSNLYLIEGKHSETSSLPSPEDIKDGLLKMILFTNLEDVKIGDKRYKITPALKLTVKRGFNYKKLNNSQKETLYLLQKEAAVNKFEVHLK